MGSLPRISSRCRVSSLSTMNNSPRGASGDQLCEDSCQFKFRVSDRLNISRTDKSPEQYVQYKPKRAGLRSREVYQSQSPHKALAVPSPVFPGEEPC